MKQTFTRADLWNDAGKAGLVLGFVPVAFMLIDRYVMAGASDAIGVLPTTIVNFILWAAKFAGCILLMRFFMRKFADSYEGVTHRYARIFGIAVALTSALIVSAFDLAYVKFINPEMFAEAFEKASESYSSMMDSNSMSMLENMKGDMPAISFLTNLIYCFLFGTVLSSILSRNIGTDENPFSDDENQ